MVRKLDVDFNFRDQHNVQLFLRLLDLNEFIVRSHEEEKQSYKIEASQAKNRSWSTVRFFRAADALDTFHQNPIEMGQPLFYHLTYCGLRFVEKQKLMPGYAYVYWPQILVRHFLRLSVEKKYELRESLEFEYSYTS